MALGHLVAEHGPDGALGVPDRQVEHEPTAVLEHVGGAVDQLAVEVLLELVVLRDGADTRLVGGELRADEDRREVEAVRLPVLDGAVDVEQVVAADDLVEAAVAERREELAHLLGEELEEVHDELRLAGEARAQLGVLGRDADGAGVQVADAHHDAAFDDERGGGEAELLGAEQRGDEHVAAGLHLSVDLHGDPVAQPVEHERLLRLGEPELPRGAGVLQRVERAGARSAVVAGDEHHVGLGLRDTGRDRADARTG